MYYKLYSVCYFKEIPSTNERNKIWDAMQSGTESRQYVRIQVIGNDGVGKTSLVRRLLGKQIDDVKSTDGIDIDKTCQIKTSDGEWIVGEDHNEEDEEEENKRLVRNKSDWIPKPTKDKDLEETIKTLRTNSLTSNTNFKDNLTRVEKTALQNLKSDKSIIIKEADKHDKVETERMEMIRRLQQAVDTKHTGAKTTTKQSLQSEQVPSKDELLEQEQTRNTHKQNLSKGQSMDTGKGLKKLKTNEPTKLAKHLFKQDNKGNEHEPTASGDLHVEPASKTISDKDNLNSVEKGKLAKHGEMDERMKDESTLSPVNQNVQTNDRITIAMLDEMDAIIVGAKNQKEKMISEGLVKCGIWDFAGQKDYYATHQTFFTPNAIYLLVADITKDIKSFKQDEESNSSKASSNYSANVKMSSEQECWKRLSEFNVYRETVVALLKDENYTDDWSLEKLKSPIWREFYFWDAVIKVVEDEEELSIKVNLPIAFKNFDFSITSVSSFVRKIRNRMALIVKRIDVTLGYDVVFDNENYSEVGPYCIKYGISLDWLKNPSKLK
ncbi:Hypothetical predicted protein, partial [Mytilus galloprovincialis]